MVDQTEVNNAAILTQAMTLVDSEYGSDGWQQLMSLLGGYDHACQDELLDSKLFGSRRGRIAIALSKPDQPPDDENGYSCYTHESFDPWEDLFDGIYGNYNSGCDQLMIEAMEALYNYSTWEFIEKHQKTEFGFAAEFVLYVLAGHEYSDYGTSPRGSFVRDCIRDLWCPLIEKYKKYFAVTWGLGNLNG